MHYTRQNTVSPRSVKTCPARRLMPGVLGGGGLVGISSQVRSGIIPSLATANNSCDDTHKPSSYDICS